jgi:hypothetical protein
MASHSKRYPTDDCESLQKIILLFLMKKFRSPLMNNRNDPDWKNLRIEVLETFTPGPPINEVAQFAGRKSIIQRLQD